MQQSTSGNWKELSAADKDILYAHAADGKAGAAQAAGILLSIDADAPMPLVRFPNFTKSRRVSRTDRSIIAQQEVSLACFPNPSNASTFVTYPAEADGMQLHVIDTKGAVVYSSTLQGNGLTELDTRALSEGLYQLVITGLPLSVKLAVQH